MTERYPSGPELKTIRRWHINNATNSKALLDFIESIWAFRRWGWKKTRHRVYCSTGGWSGNEEIIEALQKNKWFWQFNWQESRRGGHYIFEYRRRR